MTKLNAISTCGAMVSSLLCAQLTAQTPAPSPAKPARAKSAIPRGADGKPDLTGVWQPGTTTPGSWEEANSGTGLGGTGTNPNAPVLQPSLNRQGPGAPYKPEAAKKVLESFNIRAIDDPAVRCLPPGTPRLISVSLFPVQIVQTPKQVIFLYEYMNVFRVIPLNAKHPDDMEPTYMGDSVGHWEGDTLVVDVTGYNDKTWLVGAGTFHTEALHVTERYTRVNADRIDVDVVMEDPNVLTKPWPYHTTLMLRNGTRVREYVCAEDNEDPDRYEKLLKDDVKFKRQ
jgi:hypothetical protein